VKQLLENHEADVVTATSARDALAVIGAIKPDILISDIGLPEMDGYQFLEEVRRREAADGGGVPAIALTAFARSDDRTRALLAGYQAHLAKPVESSELLATVASFAELATAQRPRAAGD
jgi:CheY-like chemotaxis protein